MSEMEPPMEPATWDEADVDCYSYESSYQDDELEEAEEGEPCEAE